MLRITNPSLGDEMMAAYRELYGLDPLSEPESEGSSWSATDPWFATETYNAVIQAARESGEPVSVDDIVQEVVAQASENGTIDRARADAQRDGTEFDLDAFVADVRLEATRRLAVERRKPFIRWGIAIGSVALVGGGYWYWRRKR